MTLDKRFLVRVICLINFFLFPQLHVYPGYEPDEVTPLPEPFQAREILLTVINAQRDLRKKVRRLNMQFHKISILNSPMEGILFCTSFSPQKVLV